MYYLSGNGELEYIGDVNKDGRVAAGIRHFSAYGLLDYEKTFADVPSSFWAAEVIGDLVAKRTIEGVSADRFAPAQQVTRAEFAAMLVRLLDLKAEGPAPFADVASSKWYAKAVSACPVRHRERNQQRPLYSRRSDQAPGNGGDAGACLCPRDETAKRRASAREADLLISPSPRTGFGKR